MEVKLMNLIIRQNQVNEHLNLNQNKNDEEINQAFHALPIFLQENIKQSGIQFQSIQDLQQIANQMLRGNNQ